MIQENLRKLEELESLLESHLVGGVYRYTRTHLMITFFDNWSGLNGAQVSLARGKINALELLLRKLDELYNDENQWSSNHTPLKSI